MMRMGLGKGVEEMRIVERREMKIVFVVGEIRIVVDGGKSKRVIEVEVEVGRR